MILIGCEESQTITRAFRDKGYEAYSCDILDTRGNPDWHYKDDVLNIIPKHNWDLIIVHPDCTALALSGNAHYGKNKPKHNERVKAIDWTINLWELCKKHSKRCALENPTSVIFKYITNNKFYIHPWQFGHGETKKTGFVVNNLPVLKPTNIVGGRAPKVANMSPSKTRKRDRSITYQGIADAIVDQWGKLL